MRSARAAARGMNSLSALDGVESLLRVRLCPALSRWHADVEQCAARAAELQCAKEVRAALRQWSRAKLQHVTAALRDDVRVGGHVSAVASVSERTLRTGLSEALVTARRIEDSLETYLCGVRRLARDLQSAWDTSEEMWARAADARGDPQVPLPAPTASDLVVRAEPERLRRTETLSVYRGDGSFGGGGNLFQ